MTDVNPPVDDACRPAPLQLVPITPELRAALNPFRRTAPDPEPDETFRVGELARRSGVAVGTIKFYLREGLLQPGLATSKTQALYGHDHLRRLRVVRVLSEVGGLSIAQIRSVVHVFDDEATEPGDISQAVSYALAATGDGGARRGQPTSAAVSAPSETDPREQTDAFLDAIGMVVDAEHPGRAQLADAFAALEALGLDVHPAVFTEHARLAYELAQFEIGSLNVRFDAGDPATERQNADELVVGTVVFGAAFMALRAMAHEHEARRLMLTAPSATPTTPSEPRAPHPGSP